jgi:ABC-type antimicrobial peptide transport system permease subunit
VTSTELLVPTNDPVDTYLKRPSRWLPLLLGALGALATAISTRLRASEIAVYRMSGTSATSVVSLLTVEALLIAGTAAASAATASAVLAKGHLDATVPVVRGLAMAGVWTLTSIVASLDLAVRSPNDLAKDR